MQPAHYVRPRLTALVVLLLVAALAVQARAALGATPPEWVSSIWP